MTEISHTHATGEQIGRIVDEISPFLSQEDPIHVLMACLSLSIVIQDPDISPENLAAGVKGASEWIALYLSSIYDKTPKEQLN